MSERSDRIGQLVIDHDARGLAEMLVDLENEFLASTTVPEVRGKRLRELEAQHTRDQLLLASYAALFLKWAAHKNHCATVQGRRCDCGLAAAREQIDLRGP